MCVYIHNIYWKPKISHNIVSRRELESEEAVTEPPNENYYNYTYIVDILIFKCRIILFRYFISNFVETVGSYFEYSGNDINSKNSRFIKIFHFFLVIFLLRFNKLPTYIIGIFIALK